MSELPAIDSVTLSGKGTLFVEPLESLSADETARLIHFLESQPGVASAKLLAGSSSGVIEVQPAQIMEAHTIRPDLMTLLKPKKLVNVNFYLGRACPATDISGEMVIGAVEFAESYSTEVIDHLCQRFLELLDHHNGPSTLAYSHERFFVVTYEALRGGMPMFAILDELGVAFDYISPLESQTSSSVPVQQVVSFLLSRHN